MRSAYLTSVLVVLALGASPALAQEAEDSADDEELTIEDSAVLPSAGGHLESRAPTMDVDCEAEPDDCHTPLDGASVGPVLSTPDEAEAGEAVVAVPDEDGDTASSTPGTEPSRSGAEAAAAEEEAGDEEAEEAEAGDIPAGN